MESSIDMSQSLMRDVVGAVGSEGKAREAVAAMGSGQPTLDLPVGEDDPMSVQVAYICSQAGFSVLGKDRIRKVLETVKDVDECMELLKPMVVAHNDFVDSVRRQRGYDVFPEAVVHDAVREHGSATAAMRALKPRMKQYQDLQRIRRLPGYELLEEEAIRSALLRCRTVRAVTAHLQPTVDRLRRQQEQQLQLQRNVATISGMPGYELLEEEAIRSALSRCHTVRTAAAHLKPTVDRLRSQQEQEQQLQRDVDTISGMPGYEVLGAEAIRFALSHCASVAAAVAYLKPIVDGLQQGQRQSLEQRVVTIRALPGYELLDVEVIRSALSRWGSLGTAAKQLKPTVAILQEQQVQRDVATIRAQGEGYERLDVEVIRSALRQHKTVPAATKALKVEAAEAARQQIVAVVRAELGCEVQEEDIVAALKRHSDVAGAVQALQATVGASDVKGTGVVRVRKEDGDPVVIDEYAPSTVHGQPKQQPEQQLKQQPQQQQPQQPKQQQQPQLPKQLPKQRKQSHVIKDKSLLLVWTLVSSYTLVEEKYVRDVLSEHENDKKAAVEQLTSTEYDGMVERFTAMFPRISEEEVGGVVCSCGLNAPKVWAKLTEVEEQRKQQEEVSAIPDPTKDVVVQQFSKDVLAKVKDL